VKRTNWIVLPNLAYDALCLLNIWTGEAFYTDEHPCLLERWQPRLTAPVLEAFSRIERAIRGDGGIISANLCLLFSGVQPDNLHDLERAIVQSETLLETFCASPYFDPDAPDQFRMLLPDLLTLVQFLQSSPFEAEHAIDLGADFESKRQALQTTLETYDIVGSVEAALGHDLERQEIEVFTLAYTAPHGIKIIGNRFITAIEWSAVITARVAIHELMHPPFDLTRPELKTALEQLSQDPMLKQCFDDHDPAFGYNTWEGYVEENCVRALDQVIAESFGIAQNATERWQNEDGGMHQLAARLTPLLRTRAATGTFEDWLINQIKLESLTNPNQGSESQNLAFRISDSLEKMRF
jgi:hypothetical protein